MLLSFIGAFIAVVTCPIMVAAAWKQQFWMALKCLLVVVGTTIMAIACLNGMLVFNQKAESIVVNSAEYKAEVAANTAQLEKYFSHQGITTMQNAWWLEHEEYALVRNDLFWTYRDTFSKYLGPCPSEQKDFLDYYRNKVMPALFGKECGLTYIPAPAEAAPQK